MGKWISQVQTVIGLEIRKTFFSRRGLWVYLLAFAPALLWFVHSLDAIREQARWRELANQEKKVSSAALRSITEGMTKEEVEAKLGEPYAKMARVTRRGDEISSYRYTDGESDVILVMF